MRSTSKLLLAAALASVASLAAPRSASACGGCFVTQTENTQVSGHRMIVSASMEATTLWDQITYSGSPESFAWVLPIKGTVDVGLSSDFLFQVVEANTRVVVQSPPICPNTCGPSFGNSYNYGAEGEAKSESESPVEVLKQEVVGPYETVQLSADDPAALADWLVTHGYSVPAEIQPVIDSYVAESFDFLALKLVPGEAVSAMRPVRITSPGAGFSLPLRMVAAGTGAVTPIRLWVFGEGRYEPANFPSFTIATEELVWDWDTSSSNYTSLRKEKFAASDGFAWLVDVAGPWYQDVLPYYLGSGEALASYADADGNNAEVNLAKELELIQGAFPASGIRVTGMSAELSRKALKNDLSLNASLDQGDVASFFSVTKTVGTPPVQSPPCPPDPCAEDLGGGEWEWGGEGSEDGSLPSRPPAGPGVSGGGSGCDIGGGGAAEGALLLGGAAALAGLRRRRGRKAGAREASRARCGSR